MIKTLLTFSLFIMLQNLNAQTDLGVKINKVDATGCNKTDGSISVSVTEGTPPYTYKIGTTGSFGNNNVFTGLKPGSYYIGVADATGISNGKAVIIGGDYQFDFTTNATNATCFAKSDGKVLCNPTNGVGPFEFKYSTNSFSQWPGNTITGLPRGNNILIWGKDANGCISDKKTVNIGSPNKLIQTKPTITPATRLINNTSLNDGTITLIVSGGTLPYQYRIHGSPLISGVAYQPSNLFLGVAPTYNANSSPYSNIDYWYGQVKDVNGCESDLIKMTLSNINKLTNKNNEQYSKHNETSIGKFSDFSLSLMPNPSNGIFRLNIQSPKQDAVSIRLTDINGRSLYSTKGTPEQTYRFGESFAPGVYMVEVRQGDEVKTMKVIKNK